MHLGDVFTDPDPRDAAAGQVRRDLAIGSRVQIGNAGNATNSVCDEFGNILRDVGDARRPR